MNCPTCKKTLFYNPKLDGYQCIYDNDIHYFWYGNENSFYLIHFDNDIKYVIGRQYYSNYFRIIRSGPAPNDKYFCEILLTQILNHDNVHDIITKFISKYNKLIAFS